MVGPEEICRAIHERKLIRFNYTGDKAVGFRIVEPYQVGSSSTGKLSLSAWYLSGASESQKGQGFRIYILREIDTLTVLDEQFAGPRSEYKPGTNKIIHNVLCEL
jgi:predicted DNA-binding transcriptional regulator YafY